MTRVAEQTTASYLGFGLVIRERTVAVFLPDGRLVGTAYTMSGARRIARAYRQWGRP